MNEQAKFYPVCIIHVVTVYCLDCVVPENIQTPTTEGIGNSRGVGGSETQEIPEGRGVGQLDKSLSRGSI